MLRILRATAARRVAVAFIIPVAFGVVAYRLALPAENTHRATVPIGVTTTSPPSLPAFGTQEVKIDPVTLRLPTEWFLVRDTASHPGWDLLPSDGKSAAVVKSRAVALSVDTVLFAMDADLTTGSSVELDFPKSPAPDLSTTLKSYRVALMQPGYKITAERDLSIFGSAGAHRFDVELTLMGSPEQTYVIVVAQTAKGPIVLTFSTFKPAQYAGIFDGIVGTVKIG